MAVMRPAPFTFVVLPTSFFSSLSAIRLDVSSWWLPTGCASCWVTSVVVDCGGEERWRALLLGLSPRPLCCFLLRVCCATSTEWGLLLLLLALAAFFSELPPLLKLEN